MDAVANKRLPRWFLSFRTISFLCGFLILAFGVTFSGMGDQEIPLRWIMFSVLLHCIPLMLQLVRWHALRIYSLWFGFFLLSQQIASMFLLDLDFKTRTPNMDTQFIVSGPGLPGIHGLQHLTTDPNGFRVLPRVDYDRKTGIRIFAIGGSTTADGNLDDKSTWTFLVQEGLKATLNVPVEVINTGLPGLRARHHLATLRYVLKYRPDIVLFLVGINDWNKDIRIHFGSKAYRTPRHCFRESMFGNLLRRINDWLAEDNSNPSVPREERGTYVTEQNNSLAKGDRRQYFPAQVSEEYMRDLASIAATCTQAKLTCVFITQPTGYSHLADSEYRKSFWMTPPNEGYTLDLESLIHISSLYNRFLIDFSKQHGFPVIDLVSQIEPSYENYFDDAHYNTHGAHHVATILVRELIKVLSARQIGKPLTAMSNHNTEKDTQ